MLKDADIDILIADNGQGSGVPRAVRRCAFKAQRSSAGMIGPGTSSAIAKEITEPTLSFWEYSRRILPHVRTERLGSRVHIAEIDHVRNLHGAVNLFGVLEELPRHFQRR